MSARRRSDRSTSRPPARPSRPTAGRDERRRSADALARVDGPRGQRDGASQTRRRRSGKARRRTVALLVSATLFVGVLLAAVFPTGSLLAQRSETRAAETELAELAERRASLRKQVAEQNDPATIERRARALGWVRPGEESYSVLPAPVPAIGLPDVWPFAGLEKLLTAQR